MPGQKEAVPELNPARLPKGLNPKLVEAIKKKEIIVSDFMMYPYDCHNFHAHIDLHACVAITVSDSDAFATRPQHEFDAIVADRANAAFALLIENIAAKAKEWQDG